MVRRRSAKPLYVGSIPTAASILVESKDKTALHRFSAPSRTRGADPPVVVTNVAEHPVVASYVFCVREDGSPRHLEETLRAGVTEWQTLRT